MLRLILVVAFGSTGLMCLLGALSAVLWGPVLILTKAYGLEIQSDFWAYLGIPAVVVCTTILYYAFWVCLMGFHQALHNTH